jgi:A/G-specific adenine glycosylase
VLAWYDKHRRSLPWRAPPGEPADPYRVWLSEIMLQQTTVTAVAPYFAAFIARWPTVESLADAPVEEVMRRWAGLGYYARARNLHACARLVTTEHGGRFPDTETALRGLPGIGPYTAAAIAAIAFGRRATVVDGNVERVVARLLAIDTPLPAAKALLAKAAAALTPFERHGDHAQAMMDLGATICRPRKPACALCPVTARCAGHQRGTPEHYPRKAARPERPVRHGTAFFIRRQDGSVLLRTRPSQGLLGGMAEFPGTEWGLAARPQKAPRRPPAGKELDHKELDHKDLDHKDLDHDEFGSETALEQFPAKRSPLRVAKLRQGRTLEPVSDSTGSETALVARADPSLAIREIGPGIDPAILALLRAGRMAGSHLVVAHAFTHFRLELAIRVAEVPGGSPPPPGYRWVQERQLDREALPSVMRKVLNAVRRNAATRQAPIGW